MNHATKLLSECDRAKSGIEWDKERDGGKERERERDIEYVSIFDLSSLQFNLIYFKGRFF